MNALTKTFDDPSAFMTRPKTVRYLEFSGLDLWYSPPPIWEVRTREAFAALLELKEDWDGYGADRIRYDVLDFAGYVLREIMRYDTPAPLVSPMSHGGVMLEWHEPGIEIEIEIEAPHRVWATAEVVGESLEFSQALTNDFRKLRPIVAALTSSPKL